MKKQTNAVAKIAVAAVKKLLLDAAIVGSANIGTEPPLVAATIAGDFATVQELLATGADPNKCIKENRSEDNFLGHPPLVHAVRLGHLNIAEALLKAEADPNYKPLGRSLLSFAIWERHAELVPILLRHGADPNAKRRGVPSPLEAAIDRTDLASFQLLVQQGADPTANDSLGGSLLNRALFSYKNAVSFPPQMAELPEFAKLKREAPDLLKIVRQILIQRPNVSQPDRNGSTPLMPACCASPLDIVEEILRLGADPNAEIVGKHMNAGFRAIHCAVSFDRADVFDTLARYGADLDKPLPNGMNLVEFAKQQNALKTLRYLRKGKIEK